VSANARKVLVVLSANPQNVGYPPPPPSNNFVWNLVTSITEAIFFFFFFLLILFFYFIFFVVVFFFFFFFFLPLPFSARRDRVRDDVHRPYSCFGSGFDLFELVPMLTNDRPDLFPSLPKMELQRFRLLTPRRFSPAIREAEDCEFPSPPLKDMLLYLLIGIGQCFKRLTFLSFFFFSPFFPFSLRG